MAASLDDIEAAIFLALERMKATDGPFATVDRFHGELQSRAADGRAAKAALGAMPAAMFAFERETYARAAKTLALQQTTFVGTSIWRVFVCASELGGDAIAVKGGATTLGLHALVSMVVAACGGLAVDGLYRAERVNVLDAAPVRSRRGEYVTLVRLSARREIEAAEVEDDTLPLNEIDADVDVYGETDAAAVPIVVFKADTST